jgi:hypothetical protein
MGFWGRGDDIVDLTGGYRSQPTKKREKEDCSETNSDADSDAMRLLGGLANAGDSNNSDEKDSKENNKALGNMTERIEEVSNQIYRIEQRLEAIEKKLKI